MVRVSVFTPHGATEAKQRVVCLLDDLFFSVVRQDGQH